MAQFTKQMLAECLKKLMATKSLDKITVKELVEACGVNRQTFYYHFQDIYELLGWVYRSEAVAAISSVSFDTWQQGLKFVLDYVECNRDFCMSTYRSLGREHLERFLNEVFRTLLGQVLSTVENASGLPIEDSGFIARLYSFALSGMLLEWIADGFEPPKDILLDQLFKAMDGTLASAVHKFSYE